MKKWEAVKGKESAQQSAGVRKELEDMARERLRLELECGHEETASSIDCFSLVLGTGFNF